jgi:hypothetical protein
VWFGTGYALNVNNPYQNTAHLICSWANFAVMGGPAAALVWYLPARHNDSSGTVLFNNGGASPFGVANNDGTVLYSSLVYLVNMPE